MKTFTSSWKMHKRTGVSLCWLFQKGDRDSQEFVVLTYDGEDCVAYEGNGHCMERCRNIYFWNGPMNLDRDDSPHELHVEVRGMGDLDADPIELHVDANHTFSFRHEWGRGEIIRFVDPRHFNVALDETSDTLRVTPTPAYLKTRIPIETLLIGVVGSLTVASERALRALNTTFDEVVDEQPAKSVVVGMDYDNDRGLANATLEIVNERIANEAHWYWVHAEEVLDARPPVGRNAEWYLRCDALVRIGSNPEALAVVRRFKKMKVNAHVYEYDFPIFG